MIGFDLNETLLPTMPPFWSAPKYEAVDDFKRAHAYVARDFPDAMLDAVNNSDVLAVEFAWTETSKHDEEVRVVFFFFVFSWKLLPCSYVCRAHPTAWHGWYPRWKRQGP